MAIVEVKAVQVVDKDAAKAVYDIVVETSEEDILTAENCVPAGDDSRPLPGDFASTQKSNRTGTWEVLGYIDPKRTPKTADGEKRIYGRDGNGAEVNQVWLKNDSTILVNNDKVKAEFFPSGEFIVVNDNAHINIKADGKIEIKNPNATITMFVDGKVETINPNVTTTLFADGKVETINPNATITMFVDGKIEHKNPKSTVTMFDDGKIEHINEKSDVTMFADGRIRSRNEKVESNHLVSGEFNVFNDFGFMRLLDEGDLDLNNFIIKPNGDASSPVKVSSPSMVVNGKELAEHTHTGVSSGSSVTGPNT